MIKLRFTHPLMINLIFPYFILGILFLMGLRSFYGPWF